MGAQTATYAGNISVGGLTFSVSIALSGDLVDSAVVSVPVAWAGTLTTRTNNTDGTLTMTSGAHTITTGSKLDIYWSGGRRYICTVGTVSGTSVPISAGAGTNLPIATTAIVAMVPVQRNFYFTVANLQFLGMQANYESQFTLIDVDAATVRLNQYVAAPANTGQMTGYLWYTGLATSPVAGTTVATIYMSHSDTAAAHTMQAAFLAN